MTTPRRFKMRSEIRSKDQDSVSVIIELPQIDIIMYLG